MKRTKRSSVLDRLRKLEGKHTAVSVRVSELEGGTEERLGRLEQTDKEIETQLTRLSDRLQYIEENGEEDEDDDVDTYTWEQADGTAIRPAKMDEQHLRNAISYCVRRIMARLASAPYIEESERHVTGLSHFLREAKRRGLRV